MKSICKLIAATTIALTTLGPAVSYADDCSRVSFSFTNRWMEDNHLVNIRVKSVNIVGSEQTWNEDIRNKEIRPNSTYTTKQRRLQHHEAGERAWFTVNFEHERSGGGWDSDTHGPFEMLCRDGDNLRFTIMH